MYLCVCARLLKNGMNLNFTGLPSVYVTANICYWRWWNRRGWATGTATACLAFTLILLSHSEASGQLYDGTRPGHSHYFPKEAEEYVWLGLTPWTQSLPGFRPRPFLVIPDLGFLLQHPHLWVALFTSMCPIRAASATLCLSGSKGAHSIYEHRQIAVFMLSPPPAPRFPRPRPQCSLW